MERYPEPPPEMDRGGVVTLLKFLGPGAIIVSVWCFVGAGIMKFVQVYSAPRFITLTGEHSIQRWRFLPGPEGWMVWLLAVMTILCFPVWLSGLPKMLGGLMIWICGLQDVPIRGDERLWGMLFVMAAILLTMVQSHGALERTQTIIVGCLLSFILLAPFASQPHWLAALYGTFVPTLPAYAPWVAERLPAIVARSPWIELGTYVSAIGGGTQDYFGYIDMLREKGWGLLGRTAEAGHEDMTIATDEVNVARGRCWLRAPLADTGGSFLYVVLFTLAFTILGVALLHPQEIVPSGLQLLSVQAEFLTRMHSNLSYLYQFGVFTAFFGTIIGAYELYVRTTQECLRPVSTYVRAMPLSKLWPWVVGYCGVAGIAIMWLGGNPVNIVTPAALFGGVLTCGMWCLLMVWADHRFLPSPLRMGWFLRTLNIVSGLFLTGWGIRGVFDFVAGLL